MINLNFNKNIPAIISLFFLLQTAYGQSTYERVYPLTQDQKSPDFMQYRNRWNLKVAAGAGTTWRHKNNFLDAAVLALSAEPTYRLTNYVAVGLRGEYSFSKSYLSGNRRIRSEPIGSLSFTTDVIKLFKNQYAPFVGIGAGAYYLGRGEPLSAYENDESHAGRRNLGTRFGVSPRIGMNIKSFVLAIEVHLIDEKVYNNRDYATLKVGYTL
jgi:hypothetical protein